MYKIDDIINTIIQGDCLKEMREMPDNSVDTIITDPPYGLSFMGKKWDYDVPSIEIWKEALRVLKPGGTALIFAGSRTQHRMAVNVEDAGFILKDTIMWLYGSGFPKATDISKQIDKRLGVERKVIGKNPNHRVLKETFAMVGEPHTGNGDVTTPATPEAQLWNGHKSHGLKPAYEPILVAMKPNEGTYANNALKWGVAGLNIDAGRIPCGMKAQPHKQRKAGTLAGGGRSLNEKYGKPRFPEGKYTTDTPVGKIRNELRVPDKNPNSRFPANIILDDEAAKMLDEQSGVSKSTGGRIGKKDKSGIDFGLSGKYQKGDPGFGDKGGASRFFYVAKASKKERNMGCEGLEKKQVNDGRKNQSSIDCPQQRGITYRQNIHPTVKPLKLMEYLVKLTSMPNKDQIYLDPFLGSGTTAMACKALGKNWIGIEREPDYCKIAEARIKAIQRPLI